MCSNVFFIVQMNLLANKTSTFGANNHVLSIQNKGLFSKKCNYNIKKWCTWKVMVQDLVLVLGHLRTPDILCGGHSSNITCDQQHCTQPTTTCLPIRTASIQCRNGGGICSEGVESGELSAAWEREDLNHPRGITLHSCVGKLYKKKLGNRLGKDVEARGVHSDLQFAFREGRSAMEAVYILREIIEVGVREGRGYRLAVLIIRKTYDRVVSEVWDQMREAGYGGKMLWLIQRMYEENEGSFRLGEWRGGDWGEGAEAGVHYVSLFVSNLSGRQ